MGVIPNHLLMSFTSRGSPHTRGVDPTPIGLGALKDLESKIANVHGKRNYRVMLISGSGFTDELMERADVPGVILIGPDALFGRADLPPL